MKHFRLYPLLVQSVLATVLCATGGCASSYVRATWDDPKLGNPTTIKPLYAGVCGNVALGVRIADDFWEGRKNANSILFPFLFLSIPFDVALDTLCLPYDIFSYFSDKSDQQFWERVFQENDTSLPLEEYSGRLSKVSEHHADMLLLEDKLGFRIISKKEENSNGEIVERKERVSIPKGKISPEVRKLYQYVTQQRRQRQLREAQQEIEYYRKKKNSEAEVLHWERIRDGLFLKEQQAARDAEESAPPPEESLQPTREARQ